MFLTLSSSLLVLSCPISPLEAGQTRQNESFGLVFFISSQAPTPLFSTFWKLPGWEK